MSSRIKIIDHGYVAAMRNIHQLDNNFTKVGFPKEGKPGKRTKKGSDHPLYKEIADVATIAFYMEFGTKRIDPRPFMQNAFDKNFNAIIALRDKLYIRVVKGSLTAEAALGLLGDFLVAKTKQEIRELRDPANKQMTIDRKNSDNPLIDTGQMIQSVQHTEVSGQFEQGLHFEMVDR